MDKRDFQVLVIGAGHAGVEAALAAARCGAKTALITRSLKDLGRTSCNPAIGGVGKSHLVRELDALDGIMARATDAAGIHFRTLNQSRGPAVRALRAQIDRSLFGKAVQQLVREQIQSSDHLEIIEAEVSDLLIEEDSAGKAKAAGVRILQAGRERTLSAATLVLATGTFLAGVMHRGEKQFQGGRAGGEASNLLAMRLRKLGLPAGRLKTGTPPRLDGTTLDYSAMEPQPGDDPPGHMSFLRRQGHPGARDCHITHTGRKTAEIVRRSLARSPLFSGRITGTGPRYCPSLEDKIVRFPDKASHQIFVEPEGLDTDVVYPNGISTSLPEEVQLELVHSISGMEKARILQPGYAVEYDFFDPRALQHSLESRHLPGLFMAGQINGTTGYEEAAAQGILAGLNAARKTLGLAPWVPSREQSYLGVMVDDLVLRGASEPYRMFTSRAEHRLELRQDNADLRLTETGRQMGLVKDARWQSFCRRRELIAKERDRLKTLTITPQGPGAAKLEKSGLRITANISVFELLARPHADLNTILKALGRPDISDQAPEIAQTLQAEALYGGYLKRQKREIAQLRHRGDTPIPKDFDFSIVRGLSKEAGERLQRARPPTLGAASRLEGITAAALSLLLVYLKRHASG